MSGLGTSNHQKMLDWFTSLSSDHLFGRWETEREEEVFGEKGFMAGLSIV